MNDVLAEIKIKIGEWAQRWVHPSRRRAYVWIRKEDIRNTMTFLFENQGGRLCTASGVDTKEGIEILYHVAFDHFGFILTLRTLVGHDLLEIDSISDFLPGASWIEREIHDFLGVGFKGHPDLRRLVKAESIPGEMLPLRKKFDEKETGKLPLEA
jgi:Ni,Fe-hydrogenase III component G